MAALGGIGIAFGSLVSLLVSEYTRLFAIVLAIVFGAPATVLLAAFVFFIARERVSSFVRRAQRPRNECLIPLRQHVPVSRNRR